MQNEWQENENGNYVYPMADGGVITVYRQHAMQTWCGRYGDWRLTDDYDTPEQAMRAMERLVFEDDTTHARRIVRTRWRLCKDGESHHRIQEPRSATVKRAKSGKWYIVFGSQLVKNQWFDSAEAAMQAADNIFSECEW